MVMKPDRSSQDCPIFADLLYPAVMSNCNMGREIKVPMPGIDGRGRGICYNLTVSERKIRGSIIHHCRDAFGEIIVADDGDARSLYFGGVLQSSIRPAQPDVLVEEYNRAMMSALLFMNPRSVLLVGLGGCSLPHFLLRLLPGCSIDAVEIRQKVIDLAYDFFFLPKEGANLKIFRAAGQDFVRQEGNGSRDYDLIIVDAFDDDGPAVSLLERDFLTACRQRMNPGGICVINLWSRPRDNFPVLYAEFQKAFEGNTLKLLPAEAYWNTLVFGFRDPEPLQDLPARRPAARRLQGKYGIDFPKYLKYLYWQNFS